jgi:hypothetical protein
MELEDIETKQLMLEILSRSNDKNEWAHALLSIIEAWAENKPNKQCMAMAYQILKAIGCSSRGQMIQMVNIIDDEDVKAGKVVSWDMATGEITKVVPRNLKKPPNLGGFFFPIISNVAHVQHLPSTVVQCGGKTDPWVRFKMFSMGNI